MAGGPWSCPGRAGAQRMEEAAGGGQEALMDQCLAARGLYRKSIAKDGSCLFRAVAEQVLHSQARHYDIRIACIDYLRKNRTTFEAFIEGPFEEYLKRLENPQEWVGQVEISALSLMYKKDFVIYQEPNAPPSCVTENQFPDKIMLCFSNGNHYDIVYPATYTDSAALCQSILYEMLYEKVLSTDMSKILQALDNNNGTGEESVGSDENSESEDEDVSRNKNTTASDMNGVKSNSSNKQPLQSSGNPICFFLPRKVLSSLNPAVYRNVEYDVWLKLKRDQQKLDFSIAAGMQYSVGDKCKARLDHSGKYYDAHIQDVSSENGPVVVYVEELGKKYDVPLKNLKPLPQASPRITPREEWNTVSGKKIKRIPSASGQHFEAEHRGHKIAGKPVKPQSSLPPRLQQAVGHRQQPYCPSTGPQPQHFIEHKVQNRASAQATGRKLERERSEEFDYSSKDCNYFGLSPEQRREKQAIEESRSLYEIQHLDEQAFPSLSSQATAGEGNNQKKLLNMNNERTSKNKVDFEEHKDSSHELNHSDQNIQRIAPERQEECLQTSAAPPSCASPAPPDVLPDVLLTPVLPPAVPLIPDTVPAWSIESPSYSPTGISTQMPVAPVIPAPDAGPESAMAQAQGPSAQFTTLPVPLQSVNQPMMPLPQTLHPYQDPLYPGFPLNENGERATAPPYSMCKSGDDLPKDKSILQFFFNLGVKAYSCPTWAPHSYLYPLHQAYLNVCRMYPKIPVYPQNAWFQEVASIENENDTAHPTRDSAMQNEARVNGQCPLGGTAASPPPWFVSTVQVSGNAGQTSNLCVVDHEHVVQPSHAIYEDPVGNKSIYQQPAFGHSSFLGPVPLAHSFFPSFWYGYPMQGYIENAAVQHSTTATSAVSDLNKEYSSSVLDQNCIEQFQEAMSQSNLGAPHSPIPDVSSVPPCNGTAVQVCKVEKMCTITPIPPIKSVTLDCSVKVKQTEGPVVVPSACQADGESSPLVNATVLSCEKSEMARDPKATVVMTDTVPQSRPHRTREESSEDEREVSDMLRSGRSKNFYSQTYGARKYRNDRGYAPNRGGFHSPRNEELWKGPGSRNRDDGYQPHRGFRGRPYKSDNRRRPTGDFYRGHQDYDSPSSYQKQN